MKELEIFAERVHMLRKQRGMSQRELGEAIGLSHKSISTIESGSRTTTLEKLVILARFFQVSTDYLLGLCEEPAPRT
ncbi:helix-turn-helix transcriptional regulator [Intestinimonas aquisgranensis]|uniref:helix-turn-helix domain-containing protein n=1 Tax=Intestinimonas timonensis TaxID=1689270 RepID=UPI001D0EADB1|nr:helix-turn-helix transcriptional regulator [Intestinimonas timonensis]MCC2258902.1 helix-turn-helix domain-containing protein [Intestinimonas aquisgranensis]